MIKNIVNLSRLTGLENSKDVDEDKLNKYKYWLKELNKYES